MRNLSEMWKDWPQYRVYNVWLYDRRSNTNNCWHIMNFAHWQDVFWHCIPFWSWNSIKPRRVKSPQSILTRSLKHPIILLPLQYKMVENSSNGRNTGEHPRWLYEYWWSIFIYPNTKNQSNQTNFNGGWSTSTIAFVGKSKSSTGRVLSKSLHDRTAPIFTSYSASFRTSRVELYATSFFFLRHSLNL